MLTQLLGARTFQEHEQGTETGDDSAVNTVVQLYREREGEGFRRGKGAISRQDWSKLVEDLVKENRVEVEPDFQPR
mgnify:CR=1 FL=1